jgi:phosphotransferase system HPr (HPr) family protein
MYSEKTYSRQITFKGSGQERLREIARFVLTATRFVCPVKVGSKGQKVDGKNILALMDLTCKEGETLEVEASGPEAKECLEALEQAADEGFNPNLELIP